MKKSLFICFVFFLLISCKKEKNCNCEHSTNGVVKGVSTQTTEGECNEFNSTTYSTNRDTAYCLTCTEKK
ncbi:MAG: hypothetical protein WCP69_04650 [Bacteroidota bacterium]